MAVSRQVRHPAKTALCLLLRHFRPGLEAPGVFRTKRGNTALFESDEELYFVSAPDIQRELYYDLRVSAVAALESNADLRALTLFGYLAVSRIAAIDVKRRHKLCHWATL